MKRTRPITFTVERWYYGSLAPEPVLIYESPLKIRGGVSRDVMVAPHPLWSNDEEAALVVKNTYRMFADDWDPEFVEANGVLVMPPTRERFEEMIQRRKPEAVHDESRVPDAIQFYMSGFYPHQPPRDLMETDTYGRAAYILREHQIVGEEVRGY